MRALRKQATSHCGGERIQSLRALFVIVSHSSAHHKNTAQQQLQKKTSAFDPEQTVSDSYFYTFLICSRLISSAMTRYKFPDPTDFT